MKTDTFLQIRWIIGLLAIAAAAVVVGAVPAEAGGRGGAEPVRFATFNASLNRNNAGDLAAELINPGSPQPDTVAEIIQRVRPHVLLINEFDYDEDGEAARLFQHNYLIPSRSGYIADDTGRRGGLRPGALFVIAGDQNSDPFDGDSIAGSAQLLLDHPLVNTRVTPSSDGGPEQAALQGLANDTHLGDPAFDTADFNDSAPGNLRADYVLPRKNLRILDAGVFWPLSTGT